MKEKEVMEGYVENPPKYDPSKKYRWNPDTPFLFTGEEYGALLNSVRAILNTPEAKKIFLAQQANNMIENSLARAVQEGLVQEVDESEVLKSKEKAAI